MTFALMCLERVADDLCNGFLCSFLLCCCNCHTPVIPSDIFWEEHRAIRTKSSCCSTILCVFVCDDVCSCVRAAPQPPRSLVAMQDQMDLTQYNFQWVLDEDPEGVVTRQKITCMSGSSDTPLSVEVGRSAKSASLRGFMYLETYLCEIRAEANNVYSQAGSNATFTVAEGGQ